MNRKDQVVIHVAAAPGEQFVLHALFAALICCVVGYSYFVGLSIMNVIEHEEAISRSSSLQNAVSALEKEYFELTGSLTPAVAPNLGLGPVSKSSFVERDTRLTLVGNGSEI